MKNKIIKLVSLVLMGVMLWGNSVAFAALEQVTVSSATASSSWSGALAGHLIDGSPSYPGDTGSLWNSGGGLNNDWVKLDLGETKTFSELRLLPRATPVGNVFWNIEAAVSDNDVNTNLNDENEYVSISSGSSFAGDDISGTSVWEITNDFGAVSYRYIKIKPTNWNGSWVSVYEIEVWNDVVFQGPEFSTYIYLATLAFTFAIGYRRIPELMREKN